MRLSITELRASRRLQWDTEAFGLSNLQWELCAEAEQAQAWRWQLTSCPVGLVSSRETGSRGQEKGLGQMWASEKMDGAREGGTVADRDKREPVVQNAMWNHHNTPASASRVAESTGVCHGLA